MSNRIATAALTGRIYMGRVNKAGTDFVGQTTDVTSDVMKAIIDKAEHHGDGGFDIVAGDRRWTVNVTKRATTDKTPSADSVLEDAVHQVFMDRGWHDVPASDLWMYPTAERWQVRTLYFTSQPTIPQPIQEPVVAGEPVAWKEYAQHLEWCRTCAEDAVGACHEGSSLKVSAMAAPTITPQPTQAQAVAVPLTAKQLEAGRDAIFSTGNPYCPCDSKTFRKVAEWVELHHGITKEGGQHVP